MSAHRRLASAAAAVLVCGIAWKTLAAWRRRQRTTLRVHSLRKPSVALDSLLSANVKLTEGVDIPDDTEVLLLFMEAASSCADALAARLATLPALRGLIIPFAGPTPSMKQALQAEAARRASAGLPALLTRNSHHNAPMTAEMAVALLLAAAKRLLPADAALRRPPPMACRRRRGAPR